MIQVEAAAQAPDPDMYGIGDEWLNHKSLQTIN
jgi:hypothetical protein